MYREFFNIFLPVERRQRAERRPEEPCPSLRRLTELSIPGPPGMADHAMHVLALRDRAMPKRRR
ncbi:MAG TPA: hypothetical protein VK862_12605 [Afifellaceae bacterium]|nr:hypothetical protein [Afifellaceae bacterium]